MVEKNTKDDNTTINRGVSVHAGSLPAAVHRYLELDSSSSASASKKSFTDIRNEIQNVLDLMGPSTPAVSSTQNTSSEADNEESLCSITESDKASREKKPRSRPSSATPESLATKLSFHSSEMSISEATKISVPMKSTSSNKDSQMADIGTYSTTNFENFEDFENSCCDHAHASINPPQCMCTMGHTSSAPMVPSRAYEGYYPTPKSTRMTTADCKKRGLFEWIKQRSFDMLIKKPNPNTCDLYKINICGQEGDGVPPKRVIFDLVEGIPKPNSITVATNTIRNPVEKHRTNHAKAADISTNNNDNNNDLNCNCKEMKNITNAAMTPSKIQKNIYFDSDGNTRVDYYYFDHGNAQYFHTTDTPPVMKCEIIAEKTEHYTTKFWAEFFASIHIGVSFCISFVLQLFKFLLYSIIRPLAVGLMQMASDYCFKPFLTTCFNGLIQPFLIFLYNIATSIRDLCDPIAECCGYFCREVAVVFRAIRLCSYKNNCKDEFDCDRKYKSGC